MLQAQIADYERLLKALEPAKCEACASGRTFLAIDSDDVLMKRVCHHCGGESVGEFEAQWNSKNKLRGTVAGVVAKMNFRRCGDVE